MLKVLITDGIDNTGLEYLLSKNIVVYTLKDQYDPKEIDVIIVRSRYVVDSSFFQEFSNIKVVAKLGTGLDNIDTVYCKENNIEVINAPGVNSNATAEFAVGLLFSIVKNMFIINNKVSQKDFRRSLYYGKELSSLKIGIIGHGSIGKLISNKLLNLVDEVLIADSTLTNDIIQFEKFLLNCDVIILSLSVKNNEGFVNKNFLANCKKDALLINIARGALVQESYMCNHLNENQDFIYCTDVLTNEPNYNLDSDKQDYYNELFDYSNFIYTPHIAGMTQESQQNISLFIVKEILKFFNIEGK